MIPNEDYLMHQFVWETYNCLIPNRYIIDHDNDNKTDNRLKNLQLLTSQQNSAKYHQKFKHKSWRKDDQG